MTPNCPRCGGKTFEDSDHYGRWRACIVCGAVVELDRKGAVLVPHSREDDLHGHRRRRHEQAP